MYIFRLYFGIGLVILQYKLLLSCYIVNTRCRSPLHIFGVVIDEEVN